MRLWPRSAPIRRAIAGLTVLAAAGLPAEAGSLYLDAGVGGGAFSLKVQSFQEQKYHDTIAQEHDFSCGSAALATLLSYNYNMPVSETDVFKDMIINGDKKVISELGFSLLDIKRYLQRHGLDFEWLSRAAIQARRGSAAGNRAAECPRLSSFCRA